MATAYVTKDEFKKSPVHSIDWTELVPGGTTEDNDAALDALLEAASERVDHELNVDTLLTTTTTETYETVRTRRGDIVVRVRNFPIQSVLSVRFRYGAGPWIDVGSGLIDAIGNTVIVRLPFSDGFEWLSPSEVDRQRQPMTVEVTYTHGYDQADIPANVKMATILFAASLVKQRGSVSVTMDGTPSVMGGNPYDRGDEQKAVELLKAFKRVVVG